MFLPMNREIDSGVADSDQAIILDQVLNGVASRMSILYCFVEVIQMKWNKMNIKKHINHILFKNGRIIDPFNQKSFKEYLGQKWTYCWCG